MFLKVLSFDIEVLPKLDGGFPVADLCPIIMISFSGNYDLVGGKKKVVLILDRDGKNIKEDRGDYILGRFGDERKIIDVWANAVRQADCIIGFNQTGFDFPYIIDRSKILKMDLKIGMTDDNLWYRKRVSKGLTVATVGGVKGKIIFDILSLLRRIGEENVFKKEYNLKNLTLGWVSGEILGAEKGKLEFSVSDMLEWYKEGKREDDFISYGKRDAEVILEMVQRFRLLDMFIMLSRRSGKILQDVVDSTGYGAMVDNLLMKESIKEGRVVHTRKGRDEDVDELEGAFVLDPKLGITDKIVSADYKSMYPTIMIKHNLCYTTVVDGSISMDELGLTENDIEEITSEGGLPYGKFAKSEVYVGIIPKVLKRLLEERASLKKLMKEKKKGSAEYISLSTSQNAAKILMNSFYGYTGDKHARLYNWSVASSVTGSGRKQIVRTIKQIEETIISKNGNKYNMRVVASDTDSCYIQIIGLDTRNEIVEIAMDVIGKVNATLEKPMELAFENYIKRILVLAKKHYAMVIEDEHNKKIIINKGIESVRRDWCDYSSECMDNVIEIILNEEDISKGINESVKFIQNEASRLRKGEVNIEKLVMSKKFSKPLTWYDGKAVHAMVVKKMLSRGKKVEIGDRVSYFIMNNGKKLISEKAEDVEYVIKERMVKDIDKEYYIYKQLLAPVGRVMEVLGVKEIDVETKKQKSLMDY